MVSVPNKLSVMHLNDYRPAALMLVIMKSFERLVLTYLKNITGPLLDQQFAYQAIRAVGDTIHMGLHYILQHLDSQGTCANFSSLFNTIIPEVLHSTLSQLTVPAPVSQRSTTFLPDSSNS